MGSSVSVVTLCPAHNFVICRVFKVFHRNDHHIEIMCCAQHLGCYLEGQSDKVPFQEASPVFDGLLFLLIFMAKVN